MIAIVSFYTYAHLRADDGQIFYIGKGKDGRAWDLRPEKRGAHWNNIVRKHGCVVRVLAHWESEADAFEHEVFLIRCMRDMGLRIANKSVGGEGSSGFRWSEDSKRRLSEAKKGVSVGALNGMYGRRHSAETRALQAQRRRQVFGSRHGRATIDETTAGRINDLYGSMERKQVAAAFGVSLHVVANIWRGATWRCVTGAQR